MVSRVFDKGDIIRLCLNPTEGGELQGDARPCLVLSPASFNRLGLTLIAPITQGGDHARYAGFAVNLMGSGTETRGVVLANQIRSIDVGARGAKFKEKAPLIIVNEVIAKIEAILEI